MTRNDIERQLAEPDPIGRDLALFRTRAYRFTDDRRLYVLAEHLEEQYLAGRPPSPVAMSYVRSTLDAIRENGRMLDAPADLLAAETVDIHAEFAAREPFAYCRFVTDPAPPGPVVAIVGVPRSGTSHLYNLLASTGRFSYLTTASCWAWPTRNLHHPRRTLFTAIGEPVLTVDNKRTRIIPALVMPAECEDVWARAIPTYRHLGGHRYALHQPHLDDIDVLNGAINAHRRHCGRTPMLTKSPFNSFRIPALVSLWGSAIRFVHIVRDQHETADSMRRNHFAFVRDGIQLTAEDAWHQFASAVARHTPQAQLLRVAHRDLRGDQRSIVTRVLGWLATSSALPRT